MYVDLSFYEWVSNETIRPIVLYLFTSRRRDLV